MIVAHHMGEDLIPALVAGAAAAPMLLIALRAHVSQLVRGLRRRSQHDKRRDSAPAS
jgi:hypothetical protein